MKKHMPYLFAFTAFCQGFGVVLVLQYLSYYVTEYMGMSLGALAVVLSACTTADFVFTIITGPIVQKTMTRWGQFRPFIITCPFIIVLGYIVIFYGFKSTDTVMSIMIATCYGLTGFCWQCLTASNNGLLSRVAGASASNRLSITSKNMIAARVAGVFVNMITSPFIQWSTDRGINGYLILTLGYGFLTIFPNIFLFILTKEYDQYDPNYKAPESPANVKVLSMYLETFKNPHFIVFFISQFVVSVDNYVVMPVNTYYWRYSVGNFSLMGLAGTISVGVGIVAATVMPPISRRLGKKNSAITAYSLGAVVNVLIAFLTDGNYIAKIILVTCNTFADTIFGTWGINLYLDIAEYQEYTTGTDMRAFVISMANMTPRLAAMAGNPFAPLVLRYAGYDGASGTMANPFRMCMLIGLTPATTYVMAALILKFFYKLTDEDAAMYAEANALKRAAAGGDTFDASLLVEDDD